MPFDLFWYVLLAFMMISTWYQMVLLMGLTMFKCKFVTLITWSFSSRTLGSSLVRVTLALSPRSSSPCFGLHDYEFYGPVLPTLHSVKILEFFLQNKFYAKSTSVPTKCYLYNFWGYKFWFLVNLGNSSGMKFSSELLRSSKTKIIETLQSEFIKYDFT